ERGRLWGVGRRAFDVNASKPPAAASMKIACAHRVVPPLFCVRLKASCAVHVPQDVSIPMPYDRGQRGRATESGPRRPALWCDNVDIRDTRSADGVFLRARSDSPLILLATSRAANHSD